MTITITPSEQRILEAYARTLSSINDADELRHICRIEWLLVRADVAEECERMKRERLIEIQTQ